MAKVAGFVPAAGLSTRMGESKALMEIGGVRFLDRVVTALREGGCDPVIVSVRNPADDIGLLAISKADRVVVPPDPERGPIAGLQAALPHLGPEISAVVVLPMDHPLVEPDTIRALLASLPGRPEAILAPQTAGHRGHPVLFRRTVFPELMEPDLPEGARTVVRRNAARVGSVTVNDPGIHADLDTPEDVLRHTRGLQS